MLFAICVQHPGVIPIGGTPVAQRVKKARLTQGKRLSARRESWMAYAFILPLFVILAIFMFYPLISGLAMSLQDRSGNFVGLKNFQLLLGESRFRSNFLLSVIYVMVSVPLIICTGLLAAHLITQDSKFVKFLRPLYLQLSPAQKILVSCEPGFKSSDSLFL